MVAKESSILHASPQFKFRVLLKFGESIAKSSGDKYAKKMNILGLQKQL